MFTIEELKEYGANTEEGLSRCMNMEAFYIRMVQSFVDTFSETDIQNAVLEGDLFRIFELVHSVKGVAANLSLTPIEQPTVVISDQLRKWSKPEDREAIASGMSKEEIIAYQAKLLEEVKPQVNEMLRQFERLKNIGKHNNS